MKVIEQPIELISRRVICQEFGYDETRLDWLMTNDIVPPANAVIDGRRLAWTPDYVRTWKESRTRR